VHDFYPLLELIPFSPELLFAICNYEDLLPLFIMLVHTAT
jgi:hypothetical protein